MREGWFRGLLLPAWGRLKHSVHTQVVCVPPCCITWFVVMWLPELP
jgi:hypothetical protein